MGTEHGEGRLSSEYDYGDGARAPSPCLLVHKLFIFGSNKGLQRSGRVHCGASILCPGSEMTPRQVLRTGEGT